VLTPILPPAAAALIDLAPAPLAASGPDTAPATEPAPPASVAEDALVRGTLDRYAAAYSSLDAAAAQRVWPGVNVAALARAFDGLASQRVSLGDCRIDVAGETARANCAGSADWAAKVGDGARRTAARRWTFDLARSGGAWQIVNARVQNR
jgi:hypothetical protein